MLLEPWLFCFVWPVFNFNEFIVYFFYFSFAHAVNRFHHKKSRRNLLEDVHWITLVCETRWIAFESSSWIWQGWVTARLRGRRLNGQGTMGNQPKPHEKGYVCLSVLTSFYSWIFTSVSKASSARVYLFTSAVTVIWASPRFGHLHSQNPGDMGIPFSYYLSDLG